MAALAKVISQIVDVEDSIKIRKGQKTSLRIPLPKRTISRLERAEDSGRIFSKYNRSASDLDYILSTAPVQAGSLIWLREVFCYGITDRIDEDAGYLVAGGSEPITKADCILGHVAFDDVKWHSSARMGREQSVACLEVVNVRLERLREITDAGAEKEGLPSSSECLNEAIECFKWFWCNKPDQTQEACPPDSFFRDQVINHKQGAYRSPASRYLDLWFSKYGFEDLDPLVWVVDFNYVEANVDEFLAA